MYTLKLLVLVFLSMLAGCSDAQRSQMLALGSAAKVVCFSGGREIYNGRSTGKLHSEAQSDGWYFREEGSGDLIRVSGDCVVRN